MLAEPVEDIRPIPIAAGCELDAIVAGTTATLVGFGPDVEGGGPWRQAQHDRHARADRCGSRRRDERVGQLHR
jgi:hypothetical protein